MLFFNIVCPPTSKCHQPPLLTLQITAEQTLRRLWFRGNEHYPFFSLLLFSLCINHVYIWRNTFPYIIWKMWGLRHLPILPAPLKRSLLDVSLEMRSVLEGSYVFLGIPTRLWIFFCWSRLHTPRLSHDSISTHLTFTTLAKIPEINIPCVNTIDQRLAAHSDAHSFMRYCLSLARPYWKLHCLYCITILWTFDWNHKS